MNQSKINELIARAKARLEEKHQEQAQAVAIHEANKVSIPQESNGVTSTNQYGETITLNSAQVQATELAIQGKSFCLIGAAGTGKTTATKAIIHALEQQGIPSYQSDGHKHLNTSGTPGIVGCAFTRNAVANLKKNMPEHMKANCITIHALLEYAPVFYETFDEDGNMVKTRVFEPTRTAKRPLPSSIKVIIIEEASMPSVELFLQLIDAIHHPVQFIFIGDLNQLPPVMGTAILGYAILSLPVVELTEVYRNAGPIIKLAHRILSGKPLPMAQFSEYEVPNTIKIQPWKKKLHGEDAVMIASRAIINLIDHKAFDPEQDIVLCPYNVSFGTIELNNHIADHLTKQREVETHEVITGFSTNYFAVGDRVMYEKELGTIVKISRNVAYIGKEPQPASLHLDRWGINNSPSGAANLVNLNADARDIDAMLDAFTVVGEDDDIKRQASHVITIALDKFLDDDGNHSEDSLIELSSAGSINNLLLGYALTVHKSQGSEWRRVLLALHHSHSKMINRELLYTAITRARMSIHVICESDTFIKGINTQKVKGKTLAEKAEYFKGKAANMDLSKLRFN